MVDKVVIGDFELWHGDCREILPIIGTIDAVVTDPPYGISLANHGHMDGSRRASSYAIAGDENQNVGLHVLAWARRQALSVLFFASPDRPWPGEWRNLLVWDKGGAVGGGGDIRTCWKRTWELIQVANNGPLNGKRDESVIRWPVGPGNGACHPCQKPVGLMEYLLRKIGATRTVDPFMGSGTTGVACANIGRKFIGVELDRRWFDIACERIANAQSQGRLLLDDEPKHPMQGQLT